LKSNTKEQETTKQYLLGCAPETELAQIEERLLNDNKFYEELLIAEDELIDQYLLGGLSESEQNSFVSHFLLTPERREKLRFSAALRKYLTIAEPATYDDKVTGESPALVHKVAPRPPRRWSFGLLPGPGAGSPVLRLSLAAIVALVLFGGSWVIVSNWRSAQLHPTQHNLYSVLLTPGIVREGGDTKRISIPADKDIVRLQLELAATEDKNYRAELKTAENKTTFTSDKLRPEVENSHRVLNMDVPAEILKVGDYQVQLSEVTGSGSIEPVSRYVFRVIRP
jgi:hypothetical protein